MEKKIEFAIDFSSGIVALCISLYWAFNSDLVYQNPYLLGLFRGIILTVLLRYWIKRLCIAKNNL
jgi:hypothetical protein